MSLILGIDTGGTYTDGVIVDAATREILHKSKALTTKEDLTIGISHCLANLSFSEFDKVTLVSLSTTLATNAIVEGKGCRAGVILIGAMPHGQLPTEHHQIIKGKLDIKGRVKEEISDNEAMAAIESFRGKVDALAVSGYASVRNPGHELRIKEMIHDILGIPVVCAHELTSTLGFYERTVTSVLNAKLIPIIQDLISAIKSVLKRNHIEAPIMIVKGDGSLMLESIAAEKPIETILSGPAASVIGGLYLTGESDALIVDMGGTTTDIANITDGIVKIKKDGATVGGWQTHVQAAEICTFGIGGDSYIRLGSRGELLIGPKKAVPFCVAVTNYPSLIEDLRKIHSDMHPEIHSGVELEYFTFVKIMVGKIYNEVEEKVIKLLKERPHTLLYLAEVLGHDPGELHLDKMIENEELARISLTPTDILHAEGSYCAWNAEVSILAMKIIAKRMGFPVFEAIKKIKTQIKNQLNTVCVQSIVEFENQRFDISNDNAAKYFIQKAIIESHNDLMGVRLYLNKPIIAIGAPVSEWMSEISDKMNTRLLIPVHAEVANAIGAAVGQIMETVEILIRPDNITNQYYVYTPRKCEKYDTLEQALNYSIFTARKAAAEGAERAGSNSYEVIETHEDLFTDGVLCETRTYVETRVKAIAVGKPAWKT